MENNLKGQCLSCGYCGIRDDGWKRQMYCKQFKRGRTLAWTMHTAKVNSKGNLVPRTIDDLNLFLKNSMKGRVPPQWCIYRQRDSESKGV